MFPVRSKINSLIPSKYLTLLGFILLPVGYGVTLLEWWIDKNGSIGGIRYENYPIGNFVTVVGFFLILISPWLSIDTLFNRFKIWCVICICLVLFLIPLTMFALATGTPFQD